MKVMAMTLPKKRLGLKLRTCGVRPTRRKAARLGQHFLKHAHIAARIADAASLAPGTIVLEIGPGTGMLTRKLLARVKKVIAIEADRNLFEKLHIDFAHEIASGRLELVYGDIRTYPLSTTTALNSGYEVVANIPYYLTGEIFRMFLESENQPGAMTLLVQKEVAERIARDKKQSILSLSVQAFGTPRYEFTVPRGAFNPAPNVDSAVLTIRDISRKNFSSREEEQRFFSLIRAGFAHKRKFVWKNLIAAGLSTEQFLRVAGIPEAARAEDLPLTVWLALARK